MFLKLALEAARHFLRLQPSPHPSCFLATLMIIQTTLFPDSGPSLSAVRPRAEKVKGSSDDRSQKYLGKYLAALENGDQKAPNGLLPDTIQAWCKLRGDALCTDPCIALLPPLALT